MTTADMHVVLNEQHAKGIYKMVLYFPTVPEQTPLPGQFIHIAVPGHSLRRPISIHDASREAGTVTIYYQVKGEGTKELSRMKTGERVNIFYFLGNGFTLKENAKKVLLVGGGIGVAPLLYAAKFWAEQASFDAILGYRSKDYAYALSEFATHCRSSRIVTEDGSAGKQGYVTDLMRAYFETEKPDMILACGPTPMLKAVQALALEKGIPTQLSLEERMGCGMGACVTCSCKIKSADGYNYLRACVDGPVFDAEEVLF